MLLTKNKHLMVSRINLIILIIILLLLGSVIIYISFNYYQSLQKKKELIITLNQQKQKIKKINNDFNKIRFDYHFNNNSIAPLCNEIKRLKNIYKDNQYISKTGKCFYICDDFL